MTIDDFLIHDTESLILPDKRFFPAKIPIAHVQLRHYINHQEPGLIYYANGHDIYCLNPSTITRTHIYRVPFDVRCTAAGYGWMCVGGCGKDNDFAIIRLNNDASDLSGDVDSAIPLGLHETLLGRPAPGVASPRVKLEKMCGDIINSITIHKLYGNEEDPSEEVVAIITSNDTTLRVYSLTNDQEVARLDVPFAMNHATICPDGDLLVAVGDYNQAYFFERLEPAPKESIGSAKPSKASNWEVMNIVQLHCPREATTFGYFTTAWSPSGSLCAVGSECGYVTIFDTELIRSADWGEDAIVEICESTRTDQRPGPGAIRSMMFSPQPWDLLIWAEDCGRVVIADVRAGLKVRQVIKLDADEPNVERMHVRDFSTPTSSTRGLQGPASSSSPSTSAIQEQLRALTRQVENLRQYRLALDADVDLAAASMSSEFRELLSERRRLQRLAAIVESDPTELSAEERRVLDALQTTDARTEERDFGVSSSISANYTRPDGPATTESGERRSTALGDEFPTLGGGARLHSLASIHDYLQRERDSESSRHIYPPRRQASVVLSTDHNGNGSTANPSTEPSVIPPHVRLSDSPSVTDALRASHTRLSESPSLTDAMRAIEVEWARSRSPPTYTSGGRLHTPPPQSESYRQLLNDSPPAGARPTSSASGTSPSSPSRLRSSGLTRQRSTRSRSGSRPSASERERQMRLEDYETRYRYMARYTDMHRTTYPGRMRSPAYESLQMGWGDRSAGLAMSPDGERLWCASENGILEVKVDLWRRRVWGAEKFA